jgi:hypothetical protein
MRGLRLTRVVFQFDVLEQGILEILHLIRFWRNSLAPVNRIPSEILTLIPDFWDKDRYERDQDLVALTYVCRAWREMFISRSSLWADLDCVGKARTRVYLERSKSLPLNLSLDTEYSLPPCHPFFDIVPHAIGRLKSLSIRVTEEDLEGITTHLSRPAPLLEKLSIRSGYNHYPSIGPALFKRRPLFVARAETGVRSHRVTLEEHGQPHVAQAVLHVVGLCQGVS